MFKLDLEKAEEPEIKLPTSAGSSKKQGNCRKTSTFASLTRLKALTVWITTNLKIPKEMGIPDHLTCLLRNLYVDQEETVRTGHGTTNWFKMEKGVYQGWILSLCLTNVYAEYIMWNAQPGWSTSWNQNCQEKYQRPQICRWYHSKSRKQSGTREHLHEGEKAGLNSTFKKTKIMKSGPIISWQIDAENVQRGADFIFLGS